MRKSRNQYDIFLSYSPKETSFAQQLARALKKQGLKVWYDEGKLRIGDSILRRIESALEKSRFFILVVSPDYFNSQWSNFEMGVAMSRNPGFNKEHILPVYLEDVNPKSLPPPLAYLNGIKAQGRSVEEIANLLVQKVIRNAAKVE
ncbi:MAG: toll/interleukin-1 receptor domain-containing protein [Calditrichaeota bacterium]|nr:MAG: toll/interleukin-1 receptor domain-containing protein [Calditrichota bacterium]